MLPYNSRSRNPLFYCYQIYISHLSSFFVFLRLLCLISSQSFVFLSIFLTWFSVILPVIFLPHPTNSHFTLRCSCYYLVIHNFTKQFPVMFTYIGCFVSHFLALVIHHFYFRSDLAVLLISVFLYRSTCQSLCSSPVRPDYRPFPPVKPACCCLVTSRFSRSIFNFMFEVIFRSLHQVFFAPRRR